MGSYVNSDSKGKPLPNKGKANAIIADGGKEVDGETFQDGLVCVVENFAFDAALFCDEAEFDYVKKNPDLRPKRWIVYEPAKELSGYKG